jgi:AAA domain
MSTMLQIRYVRIRTSEGWQEPYDLDAPVVAIVGPVDTGKTSLLDCIAYALGRDHIEFRGAVHVHLREVEIGIRISSGTYVLRRARRTSSNVEVFDAAGTLIGTYPIKTQGEQQIISSWLLEQIGLDDTFASVRLPGGKGIGFSDSLLSYCYLTQGDIDRYIIQPPRLDESRLVVLKLLLNLTNPARERLIGLIRDVDNDIDKRRRHASAIQAFLAESQATNADSVQDKVTQLKEREAAAVRRLAGWRNDARAASKFADWERQRVLDARNEVGDSEEALDKVRRRYEAARAEVASLDDALAALTTIEVRSPDERPTLHLVCSTCPACDSPVADRTPQPGCCYLCGQLLPGKLHSGERRRLQLAHTQAEATEHELKEIVDETEVRAERACYALASLLEELDAQAGDAVTPFVDAIAAASAELAGVQGELASLGRIQDSHNRLHGQFEQIAQLEAEQERRREQAQQQIGLEPAEGVLDSLNEIFQRIVRGIDLPYSTGRARLDSESLLPLVDEQAFSQRGGGARSAVSVAYSLTLLTYTLENALAKLPSLLIIDSPQKNFGANRDDKELAHRVYERFLDYMAELRQVRDRRFHRVFQLIIVDNDIHTDIRRRIKVHQFRREHGFIRDLSDPHALPRQPQQLRIDTADDESGPVL